MQEVRLYQTLPNLHGSILTIVMMKYLIRRGKSNLKMRVEMTAYLQKEFSVTTRQFLFDLFFSF